MSVESALFARLSGFAGLMALVSTKIYPVLAPPEVNAPFITYQRISGDRLRGMAGNVGYAVARFQYDAWATTYAAVHAIAAQLRAALVDYTGVHVDLVFGNTTIHSIALENDQDLYDDGAKLYRASLDFMIAHSE